MTETVQGIGLMYGTEGFSMPQPLTDEQKSQIQSVLSSYDPKNLTADDAKAIFKSFREAGIQPGPGMRDAITNAGFDADQLRSLARPQGHHGHHPHQGGETNGAGTGNGQGLDVAALKSLQSILSKYDLSNLSSDQQSSLLTQLNGAGLMKSGYTIDLSA